MNKEARNYVGTVPVPACGDGFWLRVDWLRSMNGMKWKWIAEKLGMPLSTLNSCKLQHRLPSTETCTALADLFTVSLDYLLGRAGDSGTAAGCIARTGEVLRKLSEEQLVFVTDIAQMMLEKKAL